jgi:hypothetical protein
VQKRGQVRVVFQRVGQFIARVVAGELRGGKVAHGSWRARRFIEGHPGEQVPVAIALDGRQVGDVLLDVLRVVGFPLGLFAFQAVRADQPQVRRLVSHALDVSLHVRRGGQIKHVGERERSMAAKDASAGSRVSRSSVVVSSEASHRVSLPTWVTTDSPSRNSSPLGRLSRAGSNSKITVFIGVLALDAWYPSLRYDGLTRQAAFSASTKPPTLRRLPMTVLLNNAAARRWARYGLVLVAAAALINMAMGAPRRADRSRPARGGAVTAIPRPVPPTARSLFIVAPERFHDVLTPFVEHKKQRFSTRLVSLEQVLRTMTGADDPEKLKRYLYQAWRQSGLGYALLVGDVDVLPVRYMVLDRITPAAFDYAFYPSDLYYSDLARPDGAFDDWNARKNGFHAGYFGEVRGEKNKTDGLNFDDIDYRPDIAVGRWPVSTPEEAQIVAEKTMRYERDLFAGTKPGRNRGALFHVGGWVDARGLADDLAARLASARWRVEKRLYKDDRRDPQTPPPDEGATVRPVERRGRPRRPHRARIGPHLGRLFRPGAPRSGSQRRPASRDDLRGMLHGAPGDPAAL